MTNNNIPTWLPPAGQNPFKKGFRHLPKFFISGNSLSIWLQDDLNKNFCGGPGGHPAGGISEKNCPILELYYSIGTSDIQHLNKNFCGGPGGSFFKKSPLAAGGIF